MTNEQKSVLGMISILCLSVPFSLFTVLLKNSDLFYIVMLYASAIQGKHMKNNITDEEKGRFQDVIKELERVRIPICTSNDATMLAINLEGWLEQLVGRIKDEIE